MTLKIFVRIWVLLLVVLTYEAWALNQAPFYSLFALAKENFKDLSGLNIDPAPGKPISLWYGYIGFALMLLTNLYAIRKRAGWLRNWGKVPRWLDFHIFCGLSGPTFILYHTNFKIGGLVAISFWSMVVSFLSGIVGRYFYVQLGRQRAELETEAFESEKILEAPDSGFSIAQRDALLVSAGVPLGGHSVGVFGAVMGSFVGDLRLLLALRSSARTIAPAIRRALGAYAVSRRRMAYLGQFQEVMGYWHSFHLPFAVFMYLVAAIHIAAALLLGVKG